MKNPASNASIKDVEKTAGKQNQAPVREGTEQNSIHAGLHPAGSKNYPHPTPADRQYHNQDEFIHRGNNDRDEA